MRWEKVKLEDVCEIIAGQSPESEHYNQIGEGLPFFQGKADFGLHTPTVRYFTKKVTKISLPNDVLLSVRAPVGPTNICDVKSCVGRGLAAIRSSEHVYHKYLYYFFKSIEPQLANSGNGSTFSAITTKDVKKIELPLPPLSIQRQIADTLDKADALRQKDQQLLQKYDELAQAVFYEMFGDPVSNKQNGVPLSELVLINPSKKGLTIEDDAEVSFIPMEAVSEDGYLKHSYVRRYKDVAKGFTCFEEDDVLFAKITPCMENGKGAVVKNLVSGIGFGSTEFHVLRPTERVTQHFIHALLRLPAVRKEAESQMTGSAGQKRVPKSFFEKLLIDVPPKEDQFEYGRILECIEESKSKVKNSVTRSQALFDTLINQNFS